MTKDDIVKLAIEHTVSGLKFDEDGLVRFAKLVAEHERNEIIEILDASTGYVHMDEPTLAIEFIIKTAPLYAKAKSDRMFLEEYRRSKHAQLKSLAGTEVLGKQDTFAYAHPEYVEILEGIRAAVEIEERYRWLMTAAQAKVECWRTAQYSARIEQKATQ
jgi:hypothetical protein